MTSPSSTVVIVSYNSRGTLPDALDSLRDAWNQGLAECVVVDNASSDDSVDFVRTAHPWVRLIEAGGNLGFGRGCNIGIEAAKTPYVLLLNPDAAIESASLRTLVEFFDTNPHAGIIGPAVIEPSGVLQTAGALPTPLRLMLSPIWPSLSVRDQRTIEPGASPYRTTWLCGAILMLRKTLIDQVGGFDPRFFLYFEETDLCRRAQRAGWEIWAVGEAVGRHLNSSSASATGALMQDDVIAEHFYESRFYYLAKHHGRVAAALAEIVELTLMSVRAFLMFLRGNHDATFRIRMRSPILSFPPRRT
jgi:GT2 family glycosyltransferase